MKLIKSLAVLLCGVALTTTVHAIPDNPFNQFVDEFRQNSQSIGFADQLCARAVWPELAQAANEANVAEGEDFVNALHDLYCFDNPSDKILLQRLKGVTYVNDADEASRLRTLATLRKHFGNGVPIPRPWAIWISMKNGGTAVALGIDREGGGDDLEMRLVNKRWMFIRIRNGGGC